MHDYGTGLDLSSFEVVADFAVDGVPAGENLAAKFKAKTERRLGAGLAQTEHGINEGQTDRVGQGQARQREPDRADVLGGAARDRTLSRGCLPITPAAPYGWEVGLSETPGEPLRPGRESSHPSCLWRQRLDPLPDSRNSVPTLPNSVITGATLALQKRPTSWTIRDILTGPGSSADRHRHYADRRGWIS